MGGGSGWEGMGFIKSPADCPEGNSWRKEPGWRGFSQEGGRRPTGPTDSHSGEPRVHHIKLIRAAMNALTPAALSSFQACGRERDWRLEASFRRVESCIGEQI